MGNARVFKFPSVRVFLLSSIYWFLANYVIMRQHTSTIFKLFVFRFILWVRIVFSWWTLHMHLRTVFCYHSQTVLQISGGSRFLWYYCLDFLKPYWSTTSSIYDQRTMVKYLSIYLYFSFCLCILKLCC